MVSNKKVKHFLEIWLLAVLLPHHDYKCDQLIHTNSVACIFEKYKFMGQGVRSHVFW